MLRSLALDQLLAGVRPNFTAIDRDTPVDGNVSPYEIEVIAALVKFHCPRVILEIGTFDGRTTLNLAANSALEARVYTLDLPGAQATTTKFALELNEDKYIKKPLSGGRFADSPLSSKITQLFGDSATFDFSPFAGRVDFMFVDGSHSYEYVLSDTRNALAIVREGGIILWHDYVKSGHTPFPGVPRAMKEFYLTDARFSGLAQIEGTSILYLKVPKAAEIGPFEKKLIGDSTKPDYLSANLQVNVERPKVAYGESIKLQVRAVNTGAAAWLTSESPVGPVRLGAHLFNETGKLIDFDYSRNEFPHRRVTFPTEVVEFEDCIPSPPPGRYTLEFDLVADAVAWFNTPRGPAVQCPIEVTPK